MPSLKFVLGGALAIIYQASTVNAYAYGLALLTNQAISDDGGGNVVVADSTGVQCFSDTPKSCGNCGISFKNSYDQSTDITKPGIYENDKCGNPCVTYDSNGMSNDDIVKAKDNAPAGSLTVKKTGQKMNCKAAHSTDCSAMGPVGANYVNMQVVCDPSI